MFYSHYIKTETAQLPLVNGDATLKTIVIDSTGVLEINQMVK